MARVSTQKVGVNSQVLIMNTERVCMHMMCEIILYYSTFPLFQFGDGNGRVILIQYRTEDNLADLAAVKV